jgi:hypothetical protein
VRPKGNEHEELVAVAAQEVDEGPRCVRVPAERVEHERQPLLLPDRLEVARNALKNICAHLGLQVLPVACDVRQHARLKLGADLLKDSRARLEGHHDNLRSTV